MGQAACLSQIHQVAENSLVLFLRHEDDVVAVCYVRILLDFVPCSVQRHIFCVVQGAHLYEVAALTLRKVVEIDPLNHGHSSLNLDERSRVSAS